MNKITDVMRKHPEFCNTETRVPDLKYILKKYNYDEIVILDFDRHPIGIVKAESLTDLAMKDLMHPFDVKAGNLMTKMPASIGKDATLKECLDLMSINHLSVLPVVDKTGLCLGLVKRDDLLN